MGNLTMLDSISEAELAWAVATGRKPDALAGYVAGNWPDFPQIAALAAQHPGLHLLSISPFASVDADCLDVENGDATIAQVYGWFIRQRARRLWRPVIYISAGNAAALIATMNANGFPRASWRLWSAHYSGEHICGPGTCGYPQADGTQWTDVYQGRNLDVSLLGGSFFQPAPPPSPVFQPAEADVMEPLSLPAAGPAVSLPVPAGKTHLYLYADPGYRAQTPPRIRAGSTPSWSSQTLTPVFGKPSVFPLPKGTTEVTLAREDAGTVPVTPAWG